MAPGARARQLSKQRLLDTLVERALDANAFTRARVMQTWAHLASASAVPLGHYLCVTRLAIGAAGCLAGRVVHVTRGEPRLPMGPSGTLMQHACYAAKSRDSSTRC